MGRFEFILGVGYNSDEWNMFVFSFWMLYHVAFGVILGNSLYNCRTANSYMAIVRYGNYSKYYQIVLVKVLLTAFTYDGVTLLGIYLGERMMKWGVVTEFRQLFLAMGVIFFCHWFCGMLMGVCIVKFDRVREAMLIYPGILFWNLFLCNVLPSKVLGMIPGNWMHVARSGWCIPSGYSMQNVFFLSFFGVMALFAILYLGMGKYTVRRH